MYTLESQSTQCKPHNRMYVHVRVIPGAKKEKITKKSDTEFEMLIREPAERNLANQRIRELLAQEFSVEIGSVRMLTGHRSQSKMYTIEVDRA